MVSLSFSNAYSFQSIIMGVILMIGFLGSMMVSWSVLKLWEMRKPAAAEIVEEESEIVPRETIETIDKSWGLFK